MTLSKVYLHPSEWCFCEKPTVVETVLGSCVALVLWSQGLGAMCHSVLPEQGRFHSIEAMGPATFVDASVDPMLAWFKAKGIAAADLHVKIFGGAELANTGSPGSVWSTGARNVEVCRRVLAERSLSPRVSDVGGTRGRKLLFHSHTGAVYLRRLSGGGGGA
jgi:chemotaxis protein CheD